jgi:hypothetical protein
MYFSQSANVHIPRTFSQFGNALALGSIRRCNLFLGTPAFLFLPMSRFRGALSPSLSLSKLCMLLVFKNTRAEIKDVDDIMWYKNM